MSPFAALLVKLRKSRQLRQNQLAELLGYEQSYLSDLERCEKGPPRDEFIPKLTAALQLNAQEVAHVTAALKVSRRQITIPHKASADEYHLIHRLEPQLGKLLPIQVKLMNLALDLQSLDQPPEKAKEI